MEAGKVIKRIMQQPRQEMKVASDQEGSAGNTVKVKGVFFERKTTEPTEDLMQSWKKKERVESHSQVCSLSG